jgi:hypothetical protein
MKRLSIFLMLAMILSCQSDYESIQGHWHSVNLTDSSYYLTLDIQDSVAIFNKNDRYSNYAEYNLAQIDGKLIIPIRRDFFPLSDTCEVKIKNDTLYLIEKKHDFEDDQIIVSWIKPYENPDDMVNDFLSLIEYKIELPVENESIQFDSICGDAPWCMVNIGYPKSKMRANINGSLRNIEDSLVINMNDAIGNFSDFPLLLDVELDVYNDLYQSSQQNEIVLIINAHKSTPNQYFDSIMYYLDDYSRLKEIYRTYNNKKDGLIGLKKLR